MRIAAFRYQGRPCLGGMKPPRYMKSGDVVRIEVDGIGTIENRFN